MCAETSTIVRDVAADFFFDCWDVEIPSAECIRDIPRGVHYHAAQGLWFFLLVASVFVRIPYFMQFEGMFMNPHLCTHLWVRFFDSTGATAVCAYGAPLCFHNSTLFRCSVVSPTLDLQPGGHGPYPLFCLALVALPGAYFPANIDLHKPPLRDKSLRRL
jgi:hypothetical protein